MKKKALLSSIVVIAVCLTIIAGSTFALFTSKQEVNIAVTAANVDITAKLDGNSLKTWSLYETEDDHRTDGTFTNGGLATVTDEANLLLELMTPGDVAKFTIVVENNSNVHVQYRVRMVSSPVTGYGDLTEALSIVATIGDNTYPVTGSESATIWSFVEAGVDIDDIEITVSFPENGDSDNQYKNRKADIAFVVEAVQSNARVYDYVATDAASLDAAFNEDGGVIDGNGTTVVFDGSGALYLQNATTIYNTVVDARDNSFAAIYSDALYGQDPSIVLGEGAVIYAPENGLGGIVSMFRDAPVIMNKGSKIIADGPDATAILFQEGEHTLVLNDVGLIEATNGAKGIALAVSSTLNIYVKDEAAKLHYEALIVDLEASNMPSTVNWFIAGAPVQP